MKNQQDKPIFNPITTPAPEKGYFKKLFNSKAMSFVTGVAVSAGVKYAAFSLGVAAGASVVVSMVAAAAIAGAVKGALSVMKKQDEARENGQQADAWTDKESLKTIGLHMGISAAGGAVFSALSHVADGLGLFDAGTPADPIVESVTPAPESAVVQPAAGETVVPTVTEPTMTAQQMKDEAVKLFNNGVGADDPKALELFDKAAKMGNFGARIDQSYIQHWGLAGTTADPAGSITNMESVLSDMKDAGRDSTREFMRGQNLLDNWTHSADPVTEGNGGMADSVEEGNDVTRETLEQETIGNEAADLTRRMLDDEAAALKETIPVPFPPAPAETIPYPTINPR